VSRVPLQRYMLFFALMLGGTLADLGTKSWVFRKLGPPGQEGVTQEIVPGWLEWQTSLNHGGLFGIGQGWQLPLIVAAFGALVFIVYWLFVAGKAESLLLTATLGCVTAGIIGNLYDRLGLHGLRTIDGDRVHAVRDWIHFEIPGLLDWPNFNVADSLMVCGAVVLVYVSYRSPPSDESARSPVASAKSEPSQRMAG
jgi:signal peptidase II